MFNSQGRSISTRLTSMNVLVSVIALLLACLTFTGYDLITFRKAAIRSLSTQAQIIGSNSVSALLFSDPKSASQTLAAFRGDPDILSAAIYDAHGKSFAVYTRSPGESTVINPGAFAGDERHWIQGEEITLVRPILDDGNIAGYVYIRSTVPEQRRHVALYAGIAAIILLVSLTAALIVSSFYRQSIAAPIIHLAETARVVSREKDYSVQVEPLRGQGELTTLTEAFSEMLTEIRLREEALQKANDDLETRVEERTAELSAAKTELEAYSQSILAAKEELERASQFKDQFLSTMSHELRTPLNAVLGFSEMLLAERYGPLNERQQRYVNHIYKGGGHLLRLINDILDISKIEAGRLQLEIETVPIKTTFAEVVGALQSLADKKSQVLVANESAELNVLADPVRFRQILMNLLGNAIKFTPAGGTIEMAARQTGDTVRVEVRDSGPGIPLEEQARIFEAFHRLRQHEGAAEGTGLGLAITRRLVDLHGGTLGIESEMGKGSCFYFTLPLAARATKESGGKNGVAWKSGGLRVLVVEDDPAATQLLESQLASVGYEVITCNQPEQALEKAAELNPAAITLDIVMKPVSGWEILSRLKTDPRTRDIPVVVVSVLDQKDTGAFLGADGYVVKPVDRTVLLETIERCLQRDSATQQTQSILIVEDDAATREFIVEALSRYGYNVATASDGEQARQYVRENVPELVVLDLILPEVNGFQLLTEWRNSPRTSNMPILILTSKDLTMEEREYLRNNVGALFSKQEQWQGSLIKKMQQVVPLTVPA